MQSDTRQTAIACPVCGLSDFRALFSKGEASYTLYRCRGCSHRMLIPLPENDHALYEENYFLKRTDRGYNNYFSPGIRAEIERVLQLNLSQLGFFDYEENLSAERRSIDIGCAAGYCVDFLKQRGWKAQGIDISRRCAAHAREQGLDVICGDYCHTHYDHKFELITLWATIEHLSHPHKVLKKIADDLAPGGMLLVSTCNVSSLFAALHGRQWRFYNFPEHIHFFTPGGLYRSLQGCGLTPRRSITYGSGFGAPHSVLRNIADRFAKLGNGDMLLVRAEKTVSK